LPYRPVTPIFEKQESPQPSPKPAEKTFEIKTQRKRAADLANFNTSSGYWRTLLLGFAAPLLLWGGAVWAATAYGNTSVAPDTPAPTIAATETFPQAGEQDFVSAWARLDHTLAHHGYQSAQTVLQRVRDKNAARGANVCNYEWKQGQVSLVYGQSGQHLGRDMSSCADAVEKEESSQ
jgi:hypothetical protein